MWVYRMWRLLKELVKELYDLSIVIRSTFICRPTYMQLKGGLFSLCQLKVVLRIYAEQPLVNKIRRSVNHYKNVCYNIIAILNVLRSAYRLSSV